VLQGNPVAGFPSQVLESTVLPVWVNLFFQTNDSMGHPTGGHVDSSQAMLFQEINFVGQGHNMGKFKRSRFFTLKTLKYRESTTKGGRLGS
jgi:hypothetical protein